MIYLFMFYVAYNVLISMVIIYLIWKYSNSWLIRLGSTFLISSYLITYSVIRYSVVETMNLNTAKNIVKNINNKDIALQNINKFINEDLSLYNYKDNKFFFESLINYHNNNSDNISGINNYLNIYFHSRSQYDGFDINKEILRFLYISQYSKTHNNIDSNFYINVNAHGFYSDISYLTIIDNLLANNQKEQAIVTIRQLINNAKSRLNPKTIVILKEVLISLICV